MTVSDSICGTADDGSQRPNARQEPARTPRQPCRGRAQERSCAGGTHCRRHERRSRLRLLNSCPVQIIRHKTTGLPLATARNLAAKAARSPLLLFLDVDCIPLRSMIGDVADLTEREDALVCAEVRYLRAGDAKSGWTEASLLKTGRPHPVRHFPVRGPRTEANLGLFWSLAFGIRSTSFDTLGGFDERFTGYGAEDTDFGFRAAAHLPLRFLGGAIACHQHHVSYEPPLQHFTDIVANARLFHQLWGRWPMEGWLSSFVDLGLLNWTDERVDIVRLPSSAEIVAASQD